MTGTTGRRPSTSRRKRDVDAETMSGVPVDAVYGPDDGEFPGQYPYTRGPYASMYRSKLWTMRMFAGFGTPEDTNARFKEILRTRRRRPVDRVRHADADGPRLRRPARDGEVGKGGVSVDTLADMDDLFADIDLGEVSDVDDDQLRRRRSCWRCTSPSPRSTARRANASAARSRTTSSRSTRRRRSTSSRRGRRCGW